MSQIIAELKRRNVIRVVIAYLASAWLMIQIVETLFDIYELPAAALQILTTLLAIGLIPAIAISWIFELTPDGLKRDADLSNGGTAAGGKGKTLDRIIIAALSVAVVYFAVDKFVLSDDVAPIAGDQFIAVWPFENLSSDAEQEYLADGLSNELRKQLARVDELRVISQFSSSEMSNSGMSLADIADTYDVAHVLEGAVLFSGNQVRVDAQLTDTRKDVILWSNSYTRKIEDIFALQDEVAGKVVDELKMTMSVDLQPVERHDPQAYRLYLQASQILSGNWRGRLDRAEQLLNQALAIDPEYTDAIVYLYWAHSYRGDEAVFEGNPALAAPHWQDAEEYLQQAALVDPGNVQLNLARAWSTMGAPAVAAPYVEKALAREPGNLHALNSATVLMTRLWRESIAVEIGEYVVERDPLFTHAVWNLQRAYLNNGDFDLAETTARTGDALITGSYGSRWTIGIALLMKGKSEEALSEFQSIPIDYVRGYQLQGIAMALHDLDRHEESSTALAALIERENSEPAVEDRWYFGMATASAWVGKVDQAFDYLDLAVKHTPGDLRVNASSPLYDTIKDDDRWPSFLESAGLLAEQLAGIEFNPRLPPEIADAIGARSESD